MAQLHRVTGLARQGGHIFRLVALHQFRDPSRGLVAFLIERVFPQQARHHASPQLAPRINALRHRPFVRPCRKQPLPHIHLRHLPLLLSSKISPTFRGTDFSLCTPASYSHRPSTNSRREEIRAEQRSHSPASFHRRSISPLHHPGSVAQTILSAPLCVRPVIQRLQRSRVEAEESLRTSLLSGGNHRLAYFLVTK